MFPVYCSLFAKYMVFSFSSPKIIKQKDNWAQFEVSGLYPGYGVTIGNSLRRVLLSSLPGAAVVQVKIKGIQHEFSTIPGVLEDVITIIMNLKQLRFKIYTEDIVSASLSVKGEKDIKGSDFKFPSQVEIINKNALVATLTDKKAKLEMEIFIKKGIGYEPVERRQKEKLEIGVIALDAIFSPIKKVSYKVENMRVGERTDFDRLTLEIETDGAITPMNALARASEILIEHFSLFFKTFKEEEKLPKVAALVQKKKSRKIKKPSAPQKKKKSAKKRNA